MRKYIAFLDDAFLPDWGFGENNCGNATDLRAKGDMARDDWAIGRYKKKWPEQLPQNDRLTVNGRRYVEWYDCITDYIL